MMTILRNLYTKTFWSYEYQLKKAVGESKSLLDLGCGFPSPIKSFSSRLYSVGVDIFKPSIEKSKTDGIHNEYRELNVLDAGDEFKEKSFDCVLASDVIEHLSKEDGEKLINIMESLASKRVIIFTPNGFLHQPTHDGNEYQKHLSGWSVEEMVSRGYRVIGINGWKPLRREFAEIRFKPTFFWAIISVLSQTLIQYFPKHAFALLCIKELN
ncbi:MAG: class I SAM-dependent methyltransferase [Candidatus Colwellbacteria bacterium]|nr:class I SAM-dependent methyltransferase [Candidatus Colwellbacteria bacterium]